MDDLADARLEREIQLAYAEFDAAIGDKPRLQAAWLRLQTLVLSRSDNQVGKMEAERGLQ